LRTRSPLRYSLAALAVAAFWTVGHAVSFPLTSDYCTRGCLGNNLNAGFVRVTQNGTSVDVTSVDGTVLAMACGGLLALARRRRKLVV
jgi:hypothetical protein